MKQSLVKSPRSYFVAIILTIIAALVLWAGVLHVSASANLHVTNTNDSGAGSLRQAILDANASSADDEIDFQISGCLVGTPCTITLTGGELPIAANGTLTITGPGSNVVTISGGNASRIFNIATSAIVNISGLTIAAGKAANAVTGTPASDGGAIYNQGSLTISNSTISASNAGNGRQAGGLIEGRGGNGGGVFSSGALSLTNVTVINNHGGDGGAGNDCSIPCNDSVNSGDGGDGGGIYNTGTMTLDNITVTGNAGGNGAPGSRTVVGDIGGQGGKGGSGGGIYSSGPTFNLTNSTITNNNGGAGATGGQVALSSGSPLGTRGGFGGDGGNGAGIYNTGGTLNLSGSTISNNHSGNGGNAGNGLNNGFAGNGGFGGVGGNGAGIYNAGTLTLTTISISSNVVGSTGINGQAQNPAQGSPGGMGGGIYNSGTITVSSSTLNGNVAGIGGTGSFAGSGGAGGTGGRGGAIATLGTVNLVNTTLSGNSAGAGGHGGGCFNNGCGNSAGGPGGDGGGIYSSAAGTLNLTNITVSNNSTGAGAQGGNNNLGSPGSFALSGHGGGVIAGGPTNLRNTIIAKNLSTNPSLDKDVSGSFTSHGNNFIGQNNGTLGFTDGTNGDQVGTNASPKDPLLGPLQNNGGPTQTQNLPPNSPAVGTGNNCVLTANGCGDNNPDVSTDERGLPRPQGTTVDIGAVESILSTPGTPDLSAASDSGTSSTDNITNATNLQFQISGGISNGTIELLKNGVVVASSQADVNGDITLSYTDNSADGTYNFTSRSNVGGSAGSPSAPLAVTIDRTGIGVTINQAGGQADPTKNLSINYTVVFTEAVTTFTNSNVILTGTAGNLANATINITGGGSTYNVAVGNLTSTGTVIASVASNVALDVAGNQSLASTSSDNTVTYDITPPTVTIDQAAAQADPTSTLPINFTVVFNEPVSGFGNNDVSLTGSTANVSSTSINVTGGGTTYNVAIGNVTTSGTVVASVIAGAANDAAGNASLASTSLDNTVQFNFPGATVTINQAAGQTDPTNTFPINFTVVFNQSVTGFSSSGISLLGSTADVSAATINITGSGTTYNVAIGNVLSTGTVQASVNANAAVNFEGTGNFASTSTDNTVTYDNSPPTVSIDQAAAQADPTSAQPINFTVVFNKSVTGFTNKSVSLSGSTADTSLSTIVVTGSGTTYNVAVNSILSSGTIQASVLAGAGVDQAGNVSVASSSSDNTVTYNSTTNNFVVNTLGDAGDGSCDATCTLRDAVIAANAASGVKNITMNLPSCTAASACTITLSTNPLTITTGSVLIAGPGANALSISGNNLIRIFVVNANAGLSLNGLTLTAGKAPNTATFNPGGDGGAILNSGSLRLVASAITASAAGNGGNIPNGNGSLTGGSGGNGGGIASTGNLTIIGSTISGNISGFGGNGGASFAGANGGTGGVGGNGGGIYSTGNVTVINSTISGNATGNGGGGGFGNNNGSNGGHGGTGGTGGLGAGIYNNGGTVTLINDSIASNATGNGGGGGGGFLGGGAAGAGGSGGGIYITSGTTRIRNTIIAKNTAQTNGPDVFGTVASLGHNFVGIDGGSTGFTNGSNGDQVGTLASPIDPLLGTLQINGGTTATRHPQLGSPVIDAGDNCVLTANGCGDGNPPVNTDQRGATRPLSTAVDIGSVEVVLAPQTPDLLALSDSGVSTTDNTTKETNLQFSIAGAINGATVELFRNGTLVATTVADNSGTVTLGYSDNSADGVYNFTSRQISSGGESIDSAPLAVTIDRTRPTVTVNQAAGQADPTSTPPINFTVVFSESVTGFTNVGVLLDGSTADVSAATINVTGSGTTYNVAVSNLNSSGDLKVSIAANAASDAAGNTSQTSTSTDNTVTANVLPVTVTINQAASQADPTGTQPINFTVVFSVPVTGFMPNDVSLAGSTANVSAAVIDVTGSGTTYNVAISNVLTDGTVTASVVANAATGFGGRNQASTSTDNTVTLDAAKPTVTINQAAGQSDPTSTQPINFTVVFSKSVTGFSNSGVSLSGSTADVSAATINITGSGTTYNVAVGNILNAGVVRASVLANAATGLGGGNEASTSTDNEVTITVNTLVVNQADDLGDDTCDVTCTLRDAIVTANATPGPDIITFDLPACTTGSPCTLTLAKGPFPSQIDPLTIANSGSLTIQGPGSNVLKIDGNNAVQFNSTRVFFVSSGATFSLSGITVTHGTPNDFEFNTNYTGGAIYNDGGSVTVDSVVFDSNHARIGFQGGFSNGQLPGTAGSNGGAIYNSTGTMSLTHCAFTNNAAGQGGIGGGSSTFTGAGPGGPGGDGGAVYNAATMTINGTTFSGNSSGNGGTPGTRGSTPAGGGGSGGNGGAIYNTGTLTITNSTISGNHAGNGLNGGTNGNGGNGGNGGGVFNNGGTLLTVNTTISTNGSGNFGVKGASGVTNGVGGNAGGVDAATGTVKTRNTIIAGNALFAAGTGPDILGAFTSLGHNLIGKSDGGTGYTNASNGDQVGTIASPLNAMLGSLQNNGGPTQTMNPASNSPAKDTGDNCVLAQTCSSDNLGFNLTTDQRGVTRPQLSIVDIGSVERQDLSISPASLPASNGGPYNQTITASGGNGNYTFSSTGTLPNGITLSSSGLLSGTPTQSGTFNFTVTAQDTNGLVGSRAYTLIVNLPPTITAGGPLTRNKNGGATVSTIATVSDSVAGTLTVQATTVPTGISVTNIVNNSGTVSASVAATCGATEGDNTVVLTVTNGSTGLSNTANLIVNVPATSAPILTYNDQSVTIGGSLTINPATGPTGGGLAINTISILNVNTYTGSISVDNSTGVISVSGAQPLGTHTITIRATDVCGTSTDASFALSVGNRVPTISSLSPSSAQQNSTGGVVTVTGTNFISNSVVVYNGSNHSTNFVNSTTLTITLSAADTATTGAKTVEVFNPTPGGGTSNTVLFTIDPVGVCGSQSSLVAPGGSGEAAVMPGPCSQNGVDATLNHDAGASGNATLYAASYQNNPTGQSIFNVGGGFVDLKVTNAAATDSATAIFYYPGTITGTNETNLHLSFFNGTNWQFVKSSGGSDPVKNSTDNQNGTSSGGTFTVTFDNTSTPKVTELTGSVFTTSTVATPTAVDFDSATVTQVGSSALIEWKTGMEINNLGFNVYRESNGQRVQINPSLIAGSALLFGLDADLRSGFSYAWSDDAANASAGYWIEDIDLNGTTTWHGPFGISGSSSSKSMRAKSALLNDLATSAARQANSVIQREYAGDSTQSNSTQGITNGRTPTKSATVSASLQRQWQIAQQNAVKIAINKTGWYKVNANDLYAAGLVNNSGLAGLRIYVGGNEIPIKVNSADGQHLDSIEFYGVALDTPTSDTQIYWLTSSLGTGKRINVQLSPGGNGSNGPSSFQYTVERKDRSLYFSSLRNGDAENWFGPVVNSNAVSQTINVHNHDTNAVGRAQIEIALQGVTTNAHQVTISLNGQALNTTTFDGMEHHVLKLSVPESSLIEGNNQITLAAQASGDVSLIDYVRVTYAHTYAADNNALSASVTGIQPVRMGGFTSNQIRAIDVQSANQPIELEGTIDGEAGNYSISVNGAKRRNLLVFTPDKVLQPLSITANNPASLSNANNGADFVIITSKDFAQSVQPLATLRQSQGYQVKVIDIDNVYDEFSYGVHSPYAVRDFLYWTYTHWQKQPQFVMLTGSGTIDPRNYTGAGFMDFVPTKLIDTNSMETASDDWFVDFNGDGKAQMSIGRLPVHTVAEASIVVNKIIAYENSGKTEGMVLVSDLNDGIDFNSANNQIKSSLPTNLSVVDITRGQNVADAKAALIEQLTQGGRIVNYAGHGSVNLWRGGLLSASDMTSLANHKVSPLIVTMTCLNGYFQDPKLASLGEALLKVNNGGAVSVWASSGMTDSGNQTLMNQAFFSQLFGNRTLTLGEAIRAAKSATDDNDIRRTWILFGDPTMRIK